ncbi:zinc finger, CCHC-type containing protein [Tanacetum coccineum]
MAETTVKDMTTNFGELDKFEGHDFRRWQKKMHFLLKTLKVIYVLTTLMPELVEDATVEAIRIKAKWENDDYICRGHILNEESLRAQKSDKGKGKELGGPSFNITEESKNKHNKQNKGKKRSNKNNSGSSSNKKPKLECSKCGKTGHFKRDCRSVFLNIVSLISEAFYVKVDAIAWWIDSGATTHVCKDRCWFKTFEPVEDGSVLYMGDEHFTPVHGKGSVALEFSSRKTVTFFNVLYVPKLHKNLVSGPVLNKCGYKQVYESDKYILSKCGVFIGFGYYNNGMFMLNLNKVLDDSDSVYMSSSSTVVNSSLWHARLGHVHYKRMLKMSKGIIHETTAPYTPLQNVAAERKNRALKEMVNFMLSNSGLSEGFWREAMAVVRLPDPKQKTLGEKGIDCIFVGYVKHSKAYRFYVIEPNDSVSINSIIESRDAIFDENRFSSIPRPNDIIPNVQESEMDGHIDDVPSEIPEPQKDKRVRKDKSYEEDLRTYNEAMQSRDAAFWKEAIDDEIGCKWIFKRKMKGAGTIDKFKARLVIQGFRQKEGIDYFDTYAPVARITTIRLLLALVAIYNLVIHQMDVKTAFLNGDLDKKVYMKQPKGFFMPGNEHKFDSSDKGVIICLYVDDMLIFGTDQNQVYETKKFLSSRFSMKDTREADVILGIKIKRENKGTVITQSHYIGKILKKFNPEDCSPLNTPIDPVEKLKPNTGKPVDQLEYSRAIGCLMYAMTSTRPNIAYVVGRLSRFTSNSSRQHWKVITMVFKASKKQTCITSSTMESKFVALAAAGKEVKWLRNLIYEIPIWPKPIAPISIRCDSAPTMARAYSHIYNGKSRHLGVRHSMVESDEVQESSGLTPQLHENAGGLPSLKLSLHSCSLPGSTNAMGIETSIALVLPAREHECNGN